MRKEIYWEKALKQSKISIAKGSLKPLETIDITLDFYKKSDFLIRELNMPNDFLNKIGPKINPFKPWDKLLEISKIGKYHHLILNKFPVQLGHILLITNEWKPQNGWLDRFDWNAIIDVNSDTSGLWFFNSGPLAGASQPHRHIQLLRRNNHEKVCPRDDWFINYKKSKRNNNSLCKNIIVEQINLENNSQNIYDLYLKICSEIGLGEPYKNEKPLYPYNLLLSNNWMTIIRRSNDHVHGFSINGLGFAGYILVTEKSDKEYLRKNGPEKLLESFV